MSKPFKILFDKLPKHIQENIKTEAKKAIRDIRLQDLRQALQLSQERMAELLDTKQANISRIERRTDMFISTLRGYIEAMGGKLDIVARFPDGEIYINQFTEIEKKGKHNLYK